MPPVYRNVQEDHPRVCGEKLLAVKGLTTQLGSPPRMRGKAAKIEFSQGAFGITPAYAGKRIVTALTEPEGRDHPRVCGEKKLV